MKAIYEIPSLNVIEIEQGDILTFSVGSLEGLNPGGTEGPIIDSPVIDSDYGTHGEASN